MMCIYDWIVRWYRNTFEIEEELEEGNTLDRNDILTVFNDAFRRSEERTLKAMDSLISEKIRKYNTTNGLEDEFSNSSYIEYILDSPSNDNDNKQYWRAYM